MNKLLNFKIITLLFISIQFVCLAQKPKKTHDHENFVKKVTLSLAPSLITKWMPDDEAINYVAGKTDKTKAQLKSDVERLSEQVKEDAQFIIDNGIYANKYNKISVNVKQEKPVKIADIVLHCEFKGDVFDITLKDCIQTDRSWYLGGRIIPSGDGIESAIAKQEERKNKPQGGLLGKIAEMEESTNEEAAESSNRMIYQAKRFPMMGNDASSQFVQHDKIGQTMDGYYIDQDYKKVETKIKYEAPEIMMDPNKFIKINGYDIVKSNFKAFYVADQMYVFTGEYWDILVKEGAIRKLARVVKNEETGNYVLGELVQKLEMGPENTVSFMMGFKNKMAELVSDNAEMATKVKNKEDGYKFKDIDKILNEYNAWFDQQYPGKAEYLLERANGINNSGADVNSATNSTNSQDQLGKDIFNALKSENVENFKPYLFTKEDIENSSIKSEIKNKMLSEFNTDPEKSKSEWYGLKGNVLDLVDEFKLIADKSVEIEKIEFKENIRESKEVGVEVSEAKTHLQIGGQNGYYYRLTLAKLSGKWKVVEIRGNIVNLNNPAEESVEEAAEESVINESTEEAEEAEGDN
ncbi:MAG: hypothetical protein COA32_04975 [Fluviicola sp.]|nr:MAG: hypothetical protein COA32_04975 [Fluviicola sp.]